MKKSLTDDEKRKKAELATKKHKEMLSKTANTRIPRTVAQIVSVGTLAVHNPTPAQVVAIMTPIETAVKLCRERLEGKAQNKPSFKLPD